MSALRVLIVEDENIIAMLIGEVVESWGFEVCAIVATEAEAVAAAAQYELALIIADECLREGSGAAAVAAIVSTRFIPHIFISGERLSTGNLHPRAVVLQKPFTESGLLESVARALGDATHLDLIKSGKRHDRG